MYVWIVVRVLRNITMRGADMNSELCPSCRGTGLDGPTTDDIWNPCVDCEGAGEIFEGEDNE